MPKETRLFEREWFMKKFNRRLDEDMLQNGNIWEQIRGTWPPICFHETGLLEISKMKAWDQTFLEDVSFHTLPSAKSRSLEGRWSQHVHTCLLFSTWITLQKGQPCFLCNLLMSLAVLIIYYCIFHVPWSSSCHQIRCKWVLEPRCESPECQQFLSFVLS